MAFGGTTLLERQDYHNRMQLHDIQLRLTAMQINIVGLNDRDEAMSVLLQHLPNCVLGWTALEIELLSQVVALAHTMLRAFSRHLLPPRSIGWRLVKTDGTDEFGCMYSQASCIFIPGSEVSSLFQSGDMDRILDSLIHECILVGISTGKEEEMEVFNGIRKFLHFQMLPESIPIPSAPEGTLPLLLPSYLPSSPRWLLPSAVEGAYIRLHPQCAVGTSTESASFWDIASVSSQVVYQEEECNLSESPHNQEECHQMSPERLMQYWGCLPDYFWAAEDVFATILSKHVRFYFNQGQAASRDNADDDDDAKLATLLMQRINSRLHSLLNASPLDGSGSLLQLDAEKAQHNSNAATDEDDYQQH